MGRKRLCTVDCTWSPGLAYCIGIITSDGNLSKTGRHINVTSKDLDLILTVKGLLGLSNTVSRKSRGGSRAKEYYFLQFGDINFFEFLISVGLMPAKSRVLDSLMVPDPYFPDFLCGCIDGDGSLGTHAHPESSHPQRRLRLCSASPRFLAWVRERVRSLAGVQGGWIYQQEGKSVATLSFGSSDTVCLLRYMYYAKDVPALARKALIARALMGE